jgi:hypothetical protein
MEVLRNDGEAQGDPEVLPRLPIKRIGGNDDMPLYERPDGHIVQMVGINLTQEGMRIVGGDHATESHSA